ncbi:uncharacterized protein LOC110843351 [Folsomia candida]|uniref:Uncharacterized protein n=1 Tax=Folsomia candida TaxID=158441 RepID=A0A226ES72_FOLCA|nr:uncharacterized protein LOC110843351 [Folsomia candida]OXA59641.1 hypothetical protein Fcan01_05298 [Folsomia candida]
MVTTKLFCGLVILLASPLCCWSSREDDVLKTFSMSNTIAVSGSKLNPKELEKQKCTPSSAAELDSCQKKTIGILQTLNEKKLTSYLGFAMKCNNGFCNCQEAGAKIMTDIGKNTRSLCLTSDLGIGLECIHPQECKSGFICIPDVKLPNIRTCQSSAIFMQCNYIVTILFTLITSFINN